MVFWCVLELQLEFRFRPTQKQLRSRGSRPGQSWCGIFGDKQHSKCLIVKIFHMKAERQRIKKHMAIQQTPKWYCKGNSNCSGSWAEISIRESSEITHFEAKVTDGIYRFIPEEPLLNMKCWNNFFLISPPAPLGSLICWRLLKFIPFHSWLNNGIFWQTKRTELIALHKLFCTYNWFLIHCLISKRTWQ